MGPLKGLKILEFSGIGPGPFCGMLLADLGAEVIRLDKSSSHGNHNKADIHNRNKTVSYTHLTLPTNREV